MKYSVAEMLTRVPSYTMKRSVRSSWFGVLHICFFILKFKNFYNMSRLTYLYSQVRIVDDQITRLRSAISMIKDHNLDSEYASANIETQISLLHNIKKNWILQLGSLQTLPKRGTKRSSETLPTTSEPSLQQPNKLHRTAVAAIRPPAVTHQ